MNEAVSNTGIDCMYCTNPAVDSNSERARKLSSNGLDYFKKTSSSGRAFPIS